MTPDEVAEFLNHAEIVSVSVTTERISLTFKWMGSKKQESVVISAASGVLTFTQPEARNA